MNALASAARAIYGPRAATWWAGAVRRDPLARLHGRAGRLDPVPLLEQLRATGPITPTRLGNWSTTSHAVCREVLRSRAFGVRAVGEPLVGDLGGDDVDLSFLGLDAPDHTRLRRLAAPAFGAKAIAGYSATIEKTVHDLLDRAERQVAERGTFDLVDVLAAPLPITVITALLGVPDADTARFTRYGAALGGALDGVRSLRHAHELLRAHSELERLFGDLADQRRREPRDDVISALVARADDQLRPGEIVPLCTLLLIAGFETTVNLVANAVGALLDHPEQWRLLRDEPALVPGAVEEVLRWDPPVRETGRVAQEDVDLAGTHVRRGQWVITLLAGANRDPEVFNDPARFDVRRPEAAEHLAFSGGTHYCLGAPLARLEAQVALRVLLERLPRLRRAGRVTMRPTSTIRGPLRMPVSA